LKKKGLWAFACIEDICDNMARCLGSKHDKREIMDGKNRSDIKPGVHVQIVQKQDQHSGKITEGIVAEILTKSSSHPHGIKVRLTNGIVGRVKEIQPEI
jgi:uncharacterized repeat protein (TIGR03833 family)